MSERFAPKLSDADLKRLDRVGRRRGRNRPAKVPARLARTSAFAAKRRGLITDSKFERMYYVPGHSVVRVSGRELGTQHRDALYAVFRLPCRRVSVGAPPQWLMIVDTTWRELLMAMGLTQHVNNIAGLHYAFKDIKQVVISVYEGKEDQILAAYRDGKLPRDQGRMGNLLHDIEWSGLGLDDRVRISYGDWTAQMVASAKLVSLNADVQFALKSDYAKSFWPYIDGLSQHTWVDEEMLAHLVGRDLWGPAETSVTRGEFRKLCRKAFDDMVRSGGLISWRVEVRGVGRKKSHRYHHVHALRQGGEQMELPMLSEVVSEKAKAVCL
ncbi:MAG: hypothetical protein AB7E70_03275 [Hyphomicrobiaceae bacterium]